MKRSLISLLLTVAIICGCSSQPKLSPIEVQNRLQRLATLPHSPVSDLEWVGFVPERVGDTLRLTAQATVKSWPTRGEFMLSYEPDSGWILAEADFTGKGPLQGWKLKYSIPLSTIADTAITDEKLYGLLFGRHPSLLDADLKQGSKPLLNQTVTKFTYTSGSQYELSFEQFNQIYCEQIHGWLNSVTARISALPTYDQGQFKPKGSLIDYNKVIDAWEKDFTEYLDLNGIKYLRVKDDRIIKTIFYDEVAGLTKFGPYSPKVDDKQYFSELAMDSLNGLNDRELVVVLNTASFERFQLGKNELTIRPNGGPFFSNGQQGVVRFSPVDVEMAKELHDNDSSSIALFTYISRPIVIYAIDIFRYNGPYPRWGWHEAYDKFVHVKILFNISGHRISGVNLSEAGTLIGEGKEIYRTSAYLYRDYRGLPHSQIVRWIGEQVLWYHDNPSKFQHPSQLGGLYRDIRK